MILTMSGLIIVSGIIYYNKMYILKHIINIMYIMIIKGIDIYSYLAMNIIKYLPSFIYVQTFTYKSYINENGGKQLDFDNEQRQQRKHLDFEHSHRKHCKH